MSNAATQTQTATKFRMFKIGSECGPGARPFDKGEVEFAVAGETVTIRTYSSWSSYMPGGRDGFEMSIEEGRAAWRKLRSEGWHL